MERLCSLAMGVPLLGRAYDRLQGIIYRGTRRMEYCELKPCDVFQGYRTRARAYLARRWEQGAEGFVRMAVPVRNGPFVFFGWQAPPVPGGGCSGLEYPDGLYGALGFKVRLRRTRALLEDHELCFYYKVGVPAGCGFLGSRLVPPRLWSPVPAEALREERAISSDGRFLNVDVRRVRTTSSRTLEG